MVSPYKLKKSMEGRQGYILRISFINIMYVCMLSYVAVHALLHMYVYLHPYIQ